MAVWTTPKCTELDEANRWDAEAFSPYLRSLDAKIRKYPFLSEVASVTHPSEIIRNYSDAADSKLFLLAQNIRPVLPDTTVEFRIPAKTAAELPINRLEHGDVLVTRSGAHSGMCAVYLGATGDCYTSGEGLIIRSYGDIDGAYLAAFFNTSVGQALCRRAIYGSGQPHIGPKYLEQTRVPRLGETEKKSSDLVRSAYKEFKHAESLYPEAEAELLERLGWKKHWQRPSRLTYTCNLKLLSKVKRIDAEFFQPQFDQLKNYIIAGGGKTLAEVTNVCRRGVQPIYDEQGTIGVINSKHLGPQEIDFANRESVSNKFFNQADVQDAHLRYQDVLVYATGAYIGRTNVYLSSAEAIASNHVTIIRSQPKECNPIYLALFLNSPAGLMQADQYGTGSAQRELYPFHMRQFTIYLPRQKNGSLDLAWQKRLAAKVELAFAAKAAARAKIEKATQLIEKEMRF